MKESHDFSGFSEVCMADHFSGRGDVEIDFIEVLDFFDAFESDAICFFVGDLPLYVFFLHGYVSKLLIYLLRGIVRGKLIIFFLLFYWVRLLNKS